MTMLNAVSDLTITARDLRTTRISWTGTAGLAAWIFVNGERVAGPEYYSGTDRYFDLPFAPDDVWHVEVHEAATASEISASVPLPQIRPDISWTAVSGASFYRVYHTAPGESETAIMTVVHNDDIDIYSQQCPVDLEEGWHFFRVEAVTSAGVESARDAWPHFVRDIPAPISGAALAGTGGVFALTLTE